MIGNKLNSPIALLGRDGLRTAWQNIYFLQSVASGQRGVAVVYRVYRVYRVRFFLLLFHCIIPLYYLSISQHPQAAGRR